MFYQKYQPHPQLAPFVKCYFVWEGRFADEGPVLIESPPSGYGSLVFNYADPYRIQNNKYDQLEVPAAFISGQSIHRYHLKICGTVGMAGIVFKPSGLASLFGLPMYEFVEERFSVIDVLGNQVQDLEERVALAKAPKPKAALLEAFLLNRLQAKDLAPDPLDYCCNKILAQNGVVSVKQLLQEVFMSRRQFERHFLKKTGLSPKYYARIYRLSIACRDLVAAAEKDYQIIIGRGQYFDQSHFIKDFQEFMGVTPTDYYHNHSELIQYLEEGA